MKKELIRLEELIDQHVDEVREILHASDSYSVYEDYDLFKLVVIRRMKLEKMALGFTAEAFIIKSKQVYHYERESETFIKLPKGILSLLSLFEAFYRNNQKIINGYLSEIEKLESSLFDRRVPGYFMDHWFDLKKDLAQMENYYFRNATVYREFYKKTEKQFTNHTEELKDIEEIIQFQNSTINTLKGRMDSVHHYYDSIKTDHLNKTLLTLTVISGVFLPLNLIVGFFGMNTPGLYFANEPEGTQKVLVVLLTVIAVCLLGLNILRMIDKYLFRFVLGRYDFYRSLSARIDEMSERLRGN